VSVPPESVSFFGQHKTLHIVLAVLTAGFWLLVLLALYLWRKGRKVPAIITAAALGLLVLFIGIGAATGSEESAAPETVTVTQTTEEETSDDETTEDETTEDETTEEETTEEETTSEPPEPSFVTFGDGQHRVGSDIPAKTYRAPDASFGCYWARLKDFSGDLDSIIANENASGPSVVTIEPTDGGFDTSGCGEWTADLRRITESRTSFGEGTYIVRVDVGPGSYRSEGGEGCYWARLRNFSGELNGIIANDNATGAAIVEIAAGDRGFTSSGCGTWSR
jgi:hypothetical protein